MFDRNSILLNSGQADGFCTQGFGNVFQIVTIFSNELQAGISTCHSGSDGKGTEI
jgi:hypothetical protein